VEAELEARLLGRRIYGPEDLIQVMVAEPVVITGVVALAAAEPADIVAKAVVQIQVDLLI